mgnify:FL=1
MANIKPPNACAPSKGGCSYLYLRTLSNGRHLHECTKCRRVALLEQKANGQNSKDTTPAR